MEHNSHTSSNLLAGAGALLTLSGVLMALCGLLVYSGILWAAAACMFFAAWNFRAAEAKKNEEETSGDE